MATFDLTPDEATSIFDRLDRWYARTDVSAAAPDVTASPQPAPAHAGPPPVASPPTRVRAPTAAAVGARTQVRQWVASLRRRSAS
jgi:hypothetical protein